MFKTPPRTVGCFYCWYSHQLNTPLSFRRSTAGRLFSVWKKNKIKLISSGGKFHISFSVDSQSDRHVRETDHWVLGLLPDASPQAAASLCCCDNCVRRACICLLEPKLIDPLLSRLKMVVANCLFSMRNRSEVNDSRDDVRFLLRMLIRLFFYVLSGWRVALCFHSMCRSIDRIVCKHSKPSEDARAAWAPSMRFRCPLRIARSTT